MKVLKCKSIGLSLLFAAQLVAAQEELDSITITASYSKQKVTTTGRNITIIKGDYFNQLPVHSIDDLIRYLPGIEVQQRGAMGSQADILIRGGTFQQVLVVLDGLRLNDPLTGHFSSYIPIAPSEIETVEILKGASSAIYGSDAVGGVIAIHTKTYAPKRNKAIKSVDGGTSGGQYGLFTANGGMNWQDKGTAIAVGLLTNHADGVQQRGIRGYFHNTTVSGSLKQFLNPHWSISLRSACDRRDFAAQNFYTAFTSDTATEKVNLWWNQLQLLYEKNKERFSVDAGYKQASDVYDFSSASTANQNYSKIFQALALYTNRLSEKSTITTGVQYAQPSIRSNDRGNHIVNSVAAFVLWNQQVLHSLNLNPAFRREWNSVSGWELVPQLNLAYSLHKLVFRGSIGTTIRNADFTERYNNYNKAIVNSGNIGNPELSPERSLSWEAGADIFPLPGLQVSASYFQKDYSSLIDWAATPYTNMPRKDNLNPAGNYYLASNISSLLTEGVETDVRYSFNTNTHHSFFVSSGFLWLQDHPQSSSLYISSHARLLLNASVNWRWQWLSVSLTGIYKRRQEQSGNSSLAQLDKDYALFNAKFFFNLKHNRLRLFAEGDNVLNRHYADRFGSPMPGSWWSGGFQFHL
jgi:iron complex outermembrane receptor protein